MFSSYAEKKIENDGKAYNSYFENPNGMTETEIAYVLLMLIGDQLKITAEQTMTTYEICVKLCSCRMMIGRDDIITT